MRLSTQVRSILLRDLVSPLYPRGAWSAVEDICLPNGPRRRDFGNSRADIVQIDPPWRFTPRRVRPFIARRVDLQSSFGILHLPYRMVIAGYASQSAPCLEAAHLTMAIPVHKITLMLTEATLSRTNSARWVILCQCPEREGKGDGVRNARAWSLYAVLVVSDSCRLASPSRCCCCCCGASLLLGSAGGHRPQDVSVGLGRWLSTRRPLAYSTPRSHAHVLSQRRSTLHAGTFASAFLSLLIQRQLKQRQSLPRSPSTMCLLDSFYRRRRQDTMAKVRDEGCRSTAGLHGAKQPQVLLFSKMPSAAAHDEQRNQSSMRDVSKGLPDRLCTICCATPP